jgi:hypothetical protein
VAADTTVSPGGSVTADTLIENTANSGHFVFRNIDVVSGQTYAYSFFAKAFTRQWVQFEIGAVAGAAASFNVSTGVVGTVGSAFTASISAVGNGWYRCVVIYAAATTATREHRWKIALSDNTSTYTGDGTSGIFLWGAQLE